MSNTLLEERYEGKVEHVGPTRITVVYQVGEDIVEHQYEKNQFRFPPNEGDVVYAYVILSKSEVKQVNYSN